jgi:hypothetical protein
MKIVFESADTCTIFEAPSKALKYLIDLISYDLLRLADMTKLSILYSQDDEVFDVEKCWRVQSLWEALKPHSAADVRNTTLFDEVLQ